MSWRELREQPGVPHGVLVLGMHRSGTSATARMLSLLGLSTCVPDDLLLDPRGNAKGHWESISMVEQNAALLDQMGRAWWCPPCPGEAYWEDVSAVTTAPDELAAAFDAVHPDSPWVWKDPRTCLTLPLWRRALDRPLAAVVTVRNPLDVAASLAARNQLRPQLSVAMWARSTRLMLEHLAGLPVHIAAYDDLVAAPLRWADEVCGFLDGLGVAHEPPRSGEVDAFVDRELRHSRHTITDVIAEFPSITDLVELLDAARGSWASFPVADLQPEPAWIEADLVAVGSWQKVPLPARSEVIRSVIVVLPAAEASGVAQNVAAMLSAFTELIVVTDAELSEADRADLPDRVVIAVVAAGTSMGAARMAGARLARGTVLEFRDPAVAVPGIWASELARALGAGYDAVSPAIQGRNGGVGFGMRWQGPQLRAVWCGRPPTAVGPVMLLANACFALTRSMFEAVGGFDQELGCYGFDAFELSIRLHRHGYRCGVARDAVALLTGPPAAEDSVDWRGYVDDVLRLATVHLDEADLAAVVAGTLTHPGATEAIAAALVSGALADRERMSCYPPVTWRGVRPPAATAPVALVSPRPVAASLLILDSYEGEPDLDRLDPVLPADAEVLRGASLAGLGDAARGEVLVFLGQTLTGPGGWLRDLVARVRELADAAVAPAATMAGLTGGPVAGLGVGVGLDDLMVVRASGADQTVVSLLDHCVALTCATYRACGGVDPAIDNPTWSVFDLSLRLHRAGHQVICAGGLVVHRSAPLWPGSARGREEYLAGLLQVAAVHLDAESNEQLVGRCRTMPGYSDAVGVVAGRGAVRRRAEVTATVRRSAADVFGAIPTPLLAAARTEAPQPMAGGSPA